MTWTNAKTVFEIRFSEPFRTFSGKSELVRLLSDGKQSVPSTDAVNIKDKKQKISVGVTVSRLGIAVESGDYSHDIKLALATYKKIHDKYSLPPYSRLGIRRFAYIDCGSFDNYSAFVEKFKDMYYSKSPILSEADDVAVSLRYEHPLEANITIGPMRDKELTERFIEFDTDDEYPPFYLMADIDLSSNKVGTITNGAIKRFVEETEKTYREYINTIGREWS